MDAQPNTDALRRCGVMLAVLFGSRARERAGPESDADVGVLLDREIPGLMDPARSRISEALGIEVEIDLVFLADADPLLLYEVALDGRPIYEREPGTFEEFRIRAIKLFYDTEWIRRLERETLRKRFA